MPKAGVIRGSMGKTSESESLEPAVAFWPAVLEALGMTEPAVEECAALEVGLADVELLADADAAAELEA